MVAPAEAVALIPEDLPADEAAPLLCAGITVYNALRNSGARAGNLVAVQGIGGLGHLGIQYARQMGFRTVAIGRGADKKPLAQKLGAHEYSIPMLDRPPRPCRNWEAPTSFSQPPPTPNRCPRWSMASARTAP